MMLPSAFAEKPKYLQLCAFTPELEWHVSDLAPPRLNEDVLWLSGNFLPDPRSELLAIDLKGSTLQIFGIQDGKLLPMSHEYDIPGSDATAYASREFRAADANADGIDEVFVYQREAGNLELWFLGEESVRQHRPEQLFPGQSLSGQPSPGIPRSWQIADFDCDSFADLLFDFGSLGYLLFRGDARQRFTKQRQFLFDGELVGILRPRADGCARGLAEHYYSLFRTLEVPRGASDPLGHHLFAHFLGYVSANYEQRILAGDFNADSLEDVLVYRNRGLSEWWIAFSSGVSGLEFSGKGPKLIPEAADAIHVGRFDEAPGSDLIHFSSSEGTARLFSPRAPCMPHEGVQLGINGTSARSDERGMILLPESESPVLNLALESPGLRVFPKQVSRAVPEQRLHLWTLPLGKGIDYYGWTLGYEKDDFEPTVCSGYTHEAIWNKWGYGGECPAGYAAVTMSQPSRRYKVAEEIPVLSRCCRVPPDLLVPDSLKAVTMRCPEGYVSTGGSNPYLQGAETHELHCMKVNSERYVLGPQESGRYFGIASNYFFEPLRVDIEQIPLALRYGIRRGAFAEFDADGCVGETVGALLVAKGTNSCSALKYRAVLRKDERGHSQPLRYWPECRAIEGLFTPLAACTQE